MLLETHILKYGSKNIKYNLSFVERKSLGIKVLPTGIVNVLHLQVLPCQKFMKN